MLVIVICGRADATIIGGKAKNLKTNPRTKSEQRVIDILESITGRKFPTVNPKWLVDGVPLELDGYDGEGLAIEFSGPLHTKWFPVVEQYSSYYRRVERDKFKVETCKSAGVYLIVVDASLPTHLIRPYLLSRIKDYNESPRILSFSARRQARQYDISGQQFVYMPVIIVEPFRNPVLDREQRNGTYVPTSI